MTEQEAKTKWCPMVRIAIEVEGALIGINTEVLPGEQDAPTEFKSATRCIGSACMMWRESRKLVNAQDRAGGTPIWVPTSEPSGHGYCGLAGPVMMVPG